MNTQNYFKKQNINIQKYILKICHPELDSGSVFVVRYAMFKKNKVKVQNFNSSNYNLMTSNDRFRNISQRLTILWTEFGMTEFLITEFFVFRN